MALCIASKPNEKGSNSDLTNAFNLEIAEANDDTGSASVAASQSGLMPLQDRIGPSLKLLLNLDVTGANVSSVAYRMVNGASTSRRVTGEQRGEEQPVQTHDTVRLLASGTTDVSDADDAWDDSFTVTYKEGSGVGSYQTADGLYPFLFVDSASEDYWNSDPTLALLHEWVVAGTGFDEFDIDPAHTTSDETQGRGIRRSLPRSPPAGSFPNNRRRRQGRAELSRRIRPAGIEQRDLSQLDEKSLRQKAMRPRTNGSPPPGSRQR